MFINPNLNIWFGQNPYLFRKQYELKISHPNPYFVKKIIF